MFLSFNPERPDNADRLNAFRTHYGIGENVRLEGGYGGQLSGNYDRVTLLSRDRTINEPVVYPLVVEDEVVYDDVAPWPTAADGEGSSLHRTTADSFGLASTSWSASAPTPGQVGFSGPVGDFDENGVVDAADITLLCQATHDANADNKFDLNGDGVVSNQDHEFMIQNVLGTTFGDANLDGVFNSRDLVEIFQKGQYEDDVTGNSTWSEGDWNCDGDFTSRDLVAAFISGGYVAAAIPAIAVLDMPTIEIDQANVGAAVDPVMEVVVDENGDAVEFEIEEPAKMLRDLDLVRVSARESNDQLFANVQELDDAIDIDSLDELIEDSNSA